MDLTPEKSVGEEALLDPFAGAVNATRRELAGFFREAMARGWHRAGGRRGRGRREPISPGMRRAILNLLRCPRCRRGPLLPETDGPELVFGPLRCPECQAGFPVAEGVADLVRDRSTASQGPMQRGLEQPLVARTYERYVRPAMQFAVARRRFDRDSEYLLYRSLLGGRTARCWTWRAARGCSRGGWPATRRCRRWWGWTSPGR